MRLKKVKWNSSNNNSALHILVSNLSSSQLVIWRWRPCEGGLVTKHSTLWDFILYIYYILYYIYHIIPPYMEMERCEGGLVTGHPLLRLKKFNWNSSTKNLCTPCIPYIPYSIYMRVSNLSSNHFVMELEVQGRLGDRTPPIVGTLHPMITAPRLTLRSIWTWCNQPGHWPHGHEGR